MQEEKKKNQQTKETKKPLLLSCVVFPHSPNNSWHFSYPFKKTRGVKNAAASSLERA